jgi:hypothetical protein
MLYKKCTSWYYFTFGCRAISNNRIEAHTLAIYVRFSKKKLLFTYINQISPCNIILQNFNLVPYILYILVYSCHCHIHFMEHCFLLKNSYLRLRINMVALVQKLQFQFDI